MDSEYGRRQRPANWPQRERWSPEGLPGWYRDLLGEVARDLTAWRDHDPPQVLDPRCDPRHPRERVQRRAIR